MDEKDDIYEAALALASELNSKRSGLTQEEIDLSFAVTQFCGNHKSNPFGDK